LLRGVVGRSGEPGGKKSRDDVLPCTLSVISRRVLRWSGIVATGGLCALGACGHPLDLGTDIIWSTGFETGDFSDWKKQPGTGGQYGGGGPSDASVVVSSEQAHSGRYAAKFTNLADFPTPTIPPASPVNGSGLFKEGPFPQEAYYSAWYFIPQYYETISGWNILQFNIPNDVVVRNDTDAPVDLDAAVHLDASAADAGSAAPSNLLDLSLVSLPPGQRMALVLSDDRRQYLTSALPANVPFVPIGQWFQIECYYNNAPTSDGQLTVWLDGVEVYDVHRPMSSNLWVYFMPCSLADDLVPTSATLYLDDVAVSWSRVTPHGIVEVPDGW
jgi:hypothetical protein